MNRTTGKIVSSGVKHDETPVPVQLERSKRRGSVLRREALERLRLGKGGSTVDEDGGALPVGGKRGVQGGEPKCVRILVYIYDVYLPDRALMTD